MSQNESHERLTRKLAYMLRHQPDEFDVEVDKFGYADLEDVLDALSEELDEDIEVENVTEAIEAGDRPRYEIVDGKIRALYGHSIEVDPGEASEPPEELYLGMGSRDADRASRNGLSAGRRRFLHLARSEQDAIEMGRRAAPEYAIVTVFARDAWEDGVSFYDRQSLYLSDAIPTEHLEVGDIHTDGEHRDRNGRRGRGRGGRGRDGGGRGRDERRGGGRGRDSGREDSDRGRERDERPAQAEQRDERPVQAERRDERPVQAERRDERPARTERRDERPARTERRDERPARTERRDERPVRAERREERPARAERRDERPARRDERPARRRQQPAEDAPKDAAPVAESGGVAPEEAPAPREERTSAPEPAPAPEPVMEPAPEPVQAPEPEPEQESTFGIGL